MAFQSQNDVIQRFNTLSPSSSVEELDEKDVAGDEGCDRLTSLEEYAEKRGRNVNDGNNNDVVRFKGWLNYAKLHKNGKKNWNRGRLERAGVKWFHGHDIRHQIR